MSTATIISNATNPNRAEDLAQKEFESSADEQARQEFIAELEQWKKLDPTERMLKQICAVIKSNTEQAESLAIRGSDATKQLIQNNTLRKVMDYAIYGKSITT